MKYYHVKSTNVSDPFELIFSVTARKVFKYLWFKYGNINLGSPNPWIRINKINNWKNHKIPCSSTNKYSVKKIDKSEIFLLVL